MIKVEAYEVVHASYNDEDGRSLNHVAYFTDKSVAVLVCHAEADKQLQVCDAKTFVFYENLQEYGQAALNEARQVALKKLTSAERRLLDLPDPE